MAKHITGLTGADIIRRRITAYVFALSLGSIHSTLVMAHSAMYDRYTLSLSLRKPDGENFIAAIGYKPTRRIDSAQ